MSIWHVYPTYIRLVDGSHIPLVLMFQTDTRELVGGTVADTHEKVSSWIRDLTAAHGVPEEVIHVDDSSFPGLTDAITVGLAHRGYQLGTELQPHVNDLVWVIDEGRRSIATINAARPASAIHITHALRGLLTSFAQTHETVVAIRRLDAGAGPMKEAAAGLPPVAVVLDIDGVIAPIGASTQWVDDTMIGDDEGGVHLSPLMCAALDDLHRPGQVGCYWLTDWTHTMRHHLDLLPGRSWAEITAPADTPARPVRPEDRWNPAPWWKQRALDDFLRRHPEIRHVVWIDARLRPDHASPAVGVLEPCAMWTGTGRLANCTNVLLVAPDMRAGLTSDDLSSLADWIATHTAPASNASRRRAAEPPRPHLIYGDHPSEELQSHLHDFLRDARAPRSRTPPAGPS